MSVESIMQLTWAPIIVSAISFVYGLNLILSKNPRNLQGKYNKGILKDAEKYAMEGGKLLLFLSLGALFMVVLLFYDVTIAVMFSIGWIVLFGVLWKRMNDKYGPLQ